MDLKEGLERDQPLLELLVRRVCPLALALETRIGPAIEEVFHRVYRAPDAIICNVDRVIEKEMWREGNNFWDENDGSWL